MSETLKQLFSNDKADEIVSALNALSSGFDAVEYVRSIGINLLDVLEYVTWNSANGEAKLAALREAIYNPEQSQVLPFGYVKHDYVVKYRGTPVNLDPLIKIKQYSNVYEKGIDITFRYDSNITSNGAALLGSRIRSSQISNNSQSFALYQNGSKVFMHIYGGQTQSLSGVISGTNVVKFRPLSGGGSTLAINDGTPLEITGSYSMTFSLPGLAVSANPVYYSDHSQADNPSLNSGSQIGVIKIYDGNTLIGNYVPCLRIADSVIGFYDTVDKVFYSATDTSYATVGDSNCMYALGDW